MDVEIKSPNPLLKKKNSNKIYTGERISTLKLRETKVGVNTKNMRLQESIHFLYHSSDVVVEGKRGASEKKESTNKILKNWIWIPQFRIQ